MVLWGRALSHCAMLFFSYVGVNLEMTSSSPRFPSVLIVDENQVPTAGGPIRLYPLPCESPAAGGHVKNFLMLHLQQVRPPAAVLTVEATSLASAPALWFIDLLSASSRVCFGDRVHTPPSPATPVLPPPELQLPRDLCALLPPSPRPRL